MRDDVQKLFSDLTDLYKSKLNYINKLYNKEKRFRFAINACSTDDRSDFIFRDRKIIDTIDLIDFNIRTIKDTICRICGINYNQFKTYFLYRDEPSFIQLRRLINKTGSILAELASERNKLIDDMNEGMLQLAQDITSLQDVIRLRRFCIN